MPVCVSCGQANPAGFRVCGMCGAALPGEPEQREARKVVSCLFCDLVGFTARAETLDPEDVRALLAPYHARARADLERHGGTVEKFIGDAVVAIFGAPAAHEDDAERAVRAGLAIRDAARDDGLKLRMGLLRPARRSSPSTPGRMRARASPPATSSIPRRDSRRRHPSTGSSSTRPPTARPGPSSSTRMRSRSRRRARRLRSRRASRSPRGRASAPTST